MARWCSFLPAHVLSAIATSVENPQTVQEAAQTALEFHDRVTTARKEYISATAKQPGATQSADAFIPSHLVTKISGSGVAKGTVQGPDVVEADITESESVNQESVPLKTKSTSRTVCDFNHALNEDSLPGKVVRADNPSEAQDKAVNQAYENVGKVLKFYKEILGLDSFDNENTAIVSSVHFGEDFVNACKPALGQGVW